MKKFLQLAFLLFFAVGLHGQSQFDLGRDVKGKLPVARITPGVAGQCLTTDISGNTTWGSCAAGSGSVTNFSAGNLSPLFSTSVTNPTTTPSLAFTLSNAAAHKYLGNNTGLSAAPAFVQPSSTELADFSATAPASSGKIPIYDTSAQNSAGGTGAYVPGDPLVQGLVGDGSTTAENPVAIGGYDTAGTPALHRATFINGTPAGTEYGQIVRNIPSGTQTVTGSVSISNFPATQPVSGTVTVQQSTASNLKVDLSGTGANATAIKVDNSGVTQPISGTITANAGTGTFNNQQSNVTADYDTGAGTQNLTMFGIALPANGGAVAGGTSSNPFRIDPTGTTTQPVSGTVTANAGTGTFNIQANASVNLNQVGGTSLSAANVVDAGNAAFKVNCVVGCGATTGFTDNSAFTAGTTTENNIGGVFNDGLAAVTSGNAAAARITNNRGLHVNIRNASGTELATASNPLQVSLANTGANATAVKVDGSAVTQPVSISGNQAVNLTQVGGSAVVTGIGASGAGIPRVTVANDSAIGLNAGSNLVGKVGFDTTTPGTTNAVSMYQPSRTTGTLTSTTCPGTGCVSVSTAGYSIATVTLNGTYSLTPVFEFSDDGSTFYSTTCTRTDSAVQESSGGALVNTARAWDCSVYAASNFRIRASSFTSGSGSVGITLSAAPIEAAPTVALNTGSTVAATQSTSPWVENLSQFGGSNVVTGTGASGAGIPRVTVSNDSSFTGTLGDNGAAAATNRIGTLPGSYQTSYQNGTAGTQGRNADLSVGTDGLLWSANLPAMRPASYMATAAFAGSSTTDNARMPGNASNTVLLTKITVSCTQTTAGILTLTINKRSTAGSGGTSANMTVVPMDSTYAAAASQPVSYTGTGPTVGTLVGALDNYKLGCMATGTASPNDIYILNLRQKPIVLRGTAENVTVNFGGAITGGNLTVTFEWIETSTITP